MLVEPRDEPSDGGGDDAARAQVKALCAAVGHQREARVADDDGAAPHLQGRAGVGARDKRRRVAVLAARRNEDGADDVADTACDDAVADLTGAPALFIGDDEEERARKLVGDRAQRVRGARDRGARHAEDLRPSSSAVVGIAGVVIFGGVALACIEQPSAVADEEGGDGIDDGAGPDVREPR